MIPYGDVAEVQRTDKTGKDNGKELNKKDMEFLLKISDNTKTFVAEVFGNALAETLEREKTSLVNGNRKKDISKIP